MESGLVDWLRSRRSVVVGFSGGVDSSYLACVALSTLGAENTLAVIGRSPSYPDSQWQNARDIAAQFGIPVEEVDTRELEDARYAANPVNRCYFCKNELWSRLASYRPRYNVIIDGTNADDLHDHRPGALAAREHGVLSPLAELGFTKNDIRALSRARGIPTWEQPSSPCLSSRIPYGTAVTPERLDRIGAAELKLRALGIEGDLRVRYHGDLARVEISRAHLEYWQQRAHLVRDAVLEAGFDRMEIDPRGFRSGSLNVLAGVGASLHRD